MTGCCNDNNYCKSDVDPYWCKTPPTNFPSVCQVTAQTGVCTTNAKCCVNSFSGGYNDACAPGSGNCYGSNKDAPCGINYSRGAVGPCCWDTTLCYPIPEECKPGENVVSVSRCSQLPRIGGDCASILAIYNYSVQRVISRSIKFVTSYYDWLWCQNAWLLNRSSGANGQFEGTGPFVAKTAPTTPIYGPGGTRQTYPCCTDSDTCQIQADACGDACNSCDRLSPQCNPLAAGSGFLPPASLFTQLVQVLGWANFNFDQVDVCQCICNNFCQVIQILVNLDGNSKIRDFIMDNAFGSNGCLSSASPTYLGCGNLYDEGQLVDYGRKVTSVIDIMIEVLQVLDLKHDSDKAEAFMNKFCSCLTQFAAQDPCGVGCNGCPLPTGGCDPQPKSKAQGIVESNLRQQFFAMFVDLLNFLFFDRDCEDFGEKECDTSCCPKPSSVEDWMQERCRAGTGNGRAVVCSGPICARYRKKDDYKPLMSVLYAVKYTVELYTVDRSGGSDYAKDVESIYNNILGSYYNLYNSDNDESDSLVFYPDCAAPQFCCSTLLAGGKCVNICGVCQYQPGCNLYPIPCIDTRLATNCCGNGSGYSPAEGFVHQNVNGECVITTSKQNVGLTQVDANGQFTKILPGVCADTLTEGSCIYAFCQPNYNPCVVMPDVCNVIQCNDCCDPPPANNCCPSTCC